MLYNFYTIGADPELFLFNTKTGKVVSAIDKIPGYKFCPYTEGLPEGFGLQTDNILAEFNIPPVSYEEAFIHNIEFMKDFIRNKAKEIDANYDILCQASAQVPPKELRHPQALEAGCDPDYCIYQEGPNPPGKLNKTKLRSAGCHLHVGYTNNNIETSLKMLRYVDAVVGLPSILFDTDVERRKLYGKAGCFRLTDYGFEYRTLSSYWIADADKLSFIWNQLMYALYLYENDASLPSKQIVQEVINNNNVEGAKKLIKNYNLLNPTQSNFDQLCAEYLA